MIRFGYSPWLRAIKAAHIFIKKNRLPETARYCRVRKMKFSDCTTSKECELANTGMRE